VVDEERLEREFTLSVPSQSLLDCHFKCQDVPALCFAKLKEELSSEATQHAVPLQLTVSEAELRKDVGAHYPAQGKLCHIERTDGNKKESRRPPTLSIPRSAEEIKRRKRVMIIQG
jgi:hypothetical protein